MSLIYQTESIGGKRHGLYLGGKADAKSRDKLKQWGITHILNVTPPKEGSIQAGVPNYFETKFVYKRIPVYDASTSDLQTQADAAVAFISSGLCHGSVLVHCQRGVSRSTTCVAFYLMRKLGMTKQEAMALIQKQRPDVNPIPAFVSQMDEYEKKCIELGVIDLQKRKMDSQVEPKKENKKRRIGPVIGPQRGPASTAKPAASEHDHSTICGPQLASGAGEKRKEEEPKDDKREHCGEGKSPKRAVIGPSLPPDLPGNK